MCCITSMIYTTIDTFYVTQEQLENSPSRKDGVDEVTEMNLRIYGCDLIQESGILLRLPQAVMATGQVLFHRFYCKKSLVRFNVKRVAASCVWLASKLEESPRKARHVLIVFHRMECRRENLPIRHLEPSKKYTELKSDLIKMERHLLKEMGFICHVEHPHKFISSYLAVLETPPELRQEAWNLANDSLRTTLCVRYKSEVVACGVVCAAARRLQVALPENPPWWKAFDAERSWIDEVCRALARLYTLPKAKYVAVCKDGGDALTSAKSWDLHHYTYPKESLPSSSGNENSSPKKEHGASSKEVMVKAAVERVKVSERKKTVDECVDEYGGASYEAVTKSRVEKGGDRVKCRDKERSKTRENCEDNERDDLKEYRSGHHRSKVKVKDYSAEDGYHHQSTREKERRRHHSHV